MLEMRQRRGEAGVKARGTKKRGAKRVGGAAGLQQRLRGVERRLRQLQERYEIAMGAINESVYDWNISEDRVYFSGGMERVLSLPPGVLKTSFKEWHERVHPEDFARYRDATVAHMKGVTERLECDYRYRALDGTWHWARTHGLAIRDARGRAIRMIGSTGDITALKRAEDALRKTEERYALATSAAVEGIYEWDVETGRLFLTERAKAFFLLPAEELTPAAWNSRIHGEDFAGYRQAIIDHFKGRTPHLEHEYRITDGQGGYRWVLERGIGVRNADGRVTKVVGALSDITRRKRVEIKLQRARDRAEDALEQQQAAGEVLATISSSMGDTKPVFDTILQSCERLFAGKHGGLNLVGDDGLIRLAAYHGPGRAEFERIFPLRLAPESGAGVAILEQRVVHFPDVENGRDVPQATRHGCKAIGLKSVIFAPMIHEGRGLGSIFVGRDYAGPFSEREIALLKTFADQASIAIANARLFNETKQALEQQTAAAEILRVISNSPADVQPVLDALAASIHELCNVDVVIVLREGNEMCFGAHAGPLPINASMRRPLGRTSVQGRSIVDAATVHVLKHELVEKELPLAAELAERHGLGAMLGVPMLRNDVAIGSINLRKAEEQPFTPRQIELAETFAAQAAIAIENVRLFNETRESLEQQKASGEVLGVISSSIADTAPVFDKILESCQRLFAGRIVGLNLVRDDGMLHIGAYHGAHREEFERIFPIPLTPASGSGLAIVERKVVHYPDTEHGEEVPARTRQGCQAIGIKSAIFAPILWKERGLGAIFVGRDHVSSFSEKEIALLRTFADQAAIAIENLRLFNEIQEKSRQLEIASRHKSQFLANMSHELRTPLNAIIGFTRIVMRRSQEKLEPKQYENLEKILSSGEQLLALINSILDLSKVEAGRVEVHPGEVGLAPVLEQCLRTVEPLAKVALVKEFAGELPCMYVDEDKLRQIMINLLSNAAKFTERGTIRVKAQAANGSVAIAVADTGIGIAPDKLELIFEEFEQADTSSTRMYGGTGLGLAIARRLARLMGGDITAESVLGSGSTFRLTLPLRYSAPA
jgi:PAS domain S-box-containing protein